MDRIRNTGNKESMTVSSKALTSLISELWTRAGSRLGSTQLMQYITGWTHFVYCSWGVKVKNNKCRGSIVYTKVEVRDHK